MTDTAESIAHMMGFNDHQASVSSVKTHSPVALCDFLIRSSGTTVTATWRQSVEAWQPSDLSQAGYCTEQQPSVRTFTARLRGYRKLPGPDPAAWTTAPIQSAAAGITVFAQARRPSA
ncbi:IS66 family insertion sequence element accessory protein TnpA [Methylosarcina fibrata]|uniref:IS66 family insertion sequence element accessory protein TnpA n=1 Tax=Methylosarcina fibrata TaxID=105972 RepID=UPI000370F91F|nr:hypothetical protein [Methylosarcina fibrata]